MASAAKKSDQATKVYDYRQDMKPATPRGPKARPVPKGGK